MFQIARDGHHEELVTYLDTTESRLEDVNDFDSKINSPLHYAVRYSHIDIVRTLLDHNARVNLVGSDGMTPVHYAARYGKNLTTRCMQEVGIKEYEPCF